MSDKEKSEKDYRKVDQPKSPSVFSEPNELNEALDNLDAYENWSNTDNLFQSTDGDRLVVEKHEPFEDADKAKKVKKEAAKKEKNDSQSETKEFKNIENELKELMDILKDSDAYSDYLGLSDTDFNEDKVNTKEFPMDDNVKKNLKIDAGLLIFAERFVPKVEPPSYRFNQKLGWPKDVNNQLQELLANHEGMPLGFSNHLFDQARQQQQLGQFSGQNGHGVHPEDIPNLNGQFPSRNNGWNPVEVEHNGNNITKILMRGPMNQTHDAVMPIIPAGGTRKNPFAKTIWTNPKNDNHRTLDLNTVHTPQEFQMGKLPKRRTATTEDIKKPGYKPIPHDSPGALRMIKDKFLHPPLPVTSEENVA